MNWFLIWMGGVAASGFIFGMVSPKKELESEMMIVAICCFAWPIIMPFLLAVWIGQMLH